MVRRFMMAVMVPALAGVLFTTTAFAQATPAGTQPAAGEASLVFEVIGIDRNVRVAPAGTDPKLAAGWQPVKLGDSLRAGQAVHVPIRGKLKLVARPADPPTVLLFDTGSLIQISELSLKDGVAVCRMDLGYGQIKAGVAEGSTRSDLEIRSPAATLSKKGTDIFGMEVRPDGRFNMFLTDQGRGLVQAIQMQSTQMGAMNAMRSRLITPGQWITHQMARAIDNVQFDRNVSINDVYGLKGVDQLFTMLNDRGFGIFLPAGGGSPLNFQGSQTTEEGQAPPGMGQQIQPFPQLFQGIRNITEGNFGIGQGNVPSVFGTQAINRQRGQFRSVGGQTGGFGQRR
ncbi:MAG TPA: hypothetical protein VJZ71_21375 [Phycisphaerae bacterium]|nr:hypothetical protein [Phycisphaerae bacterium]